MSDYTPTTSEVASGFVAHRSRICPHDEVPRIAEAFEQWLASVKAQAWDLGCHAGHLECGGSEPAINPYRTRT